MDFNKVPYFIAFTYFTFIEKWEVVGVVVLIIINCKDLLVTYLDSLLALDSKVEVISIPWANTCLEVEEVIMVIIKYNYY